MPACARCDDGMEPKPSGITAALGLASASGYECEDCGTLLCTECYRRRTVELGGASHDRCPTCNGALSPR